MIQQNNKHRWGVILAGGDGSRLKTLTRAIAGDDRPKQFCSLFGDKTLLDQTQRRVMRLLNPKSILTVVTLTHESFYKDQLQAWPKDRLLAQPDNKGTAPAILLSLLRISQLSPKAVVAFFPSDHHFDDEARFMSQVEVAFELTEAQGNGITLLGISATQSEVQYGWIEPVISSGQPPDLRLLPVRRFWEKPSRAIAQRLMRGGALWNSFVMVGHVKAFLEMIFSTLPELYSTFFAAQEVLGSTKEERVLRELYAQIASTNFSHEVLALRPTELSVLKLDNVGWADLGEPTRVVATIQSERMHKWPGRLVYSQYKLNKRTNVHPDPNRIARMGNMTKKQLNIDAIRHDEGEITMRGPKYPSLYQVNTRVWLTRLSERLGRPATLDDIPNAALDWLSEKGFDWVWFLSVWQTGQASQKISRSLPEWRREFEETLPDLREEDIEGSGFAITNYTTHASLGGDRGLARLRERLNQRGLRLMLDFVPNHTGLDHVWVEEHPEYYVGGSEEDVIREPQNYGWARRKAGDLVLGYGRDPYFPGWSDTFQLNYGNRSTQEAMRGELLRIAGQCDGVRCDMAMLLLPEVFERTWGIPAEPFWPRTTATVREAYPDFCFMAEVYWDLEWTLQQQGFSYTYDKRLYDRLRDGHARPVREHFLADADYQNKSARFLENHDETRAATAFPYDVHRAAAVITFLSPGLRFFHQGEFEGRRKRISPHLVRAPEEPVDGPLIDFYDRLLTVLRQSIVREGQWQLLECLPAWDENWTSDSFVAFAWQHADGSRLLVAVNYSPHQSQCYVKLPFGDLGKREWQLRDLVGDAVYDRHGDDLQARGLYLDEPAWSASIFSLTVSTGQQKTEELPTPLSARGAAS